MKRIILILALMTILLIPVTALAATEVDTWVLTGTRWQHDGSSTEPNLEALSRCWSSEPDGNYCNANWEVEFTNHASVAQWCWWSVTGTRWDWKVRKPGTYAADCITFVVKSNGDVGFAFSEFDDLYSQESIGKQYIETWYALGGMEPPGPDSPAWIAAEYLNDYTPTIQETVDLHTDGEMYKLWNKIKVEECNSACEYENTGYITIIQKEQKDWIDPETGFFKGAV